MKMHGLSSFQNKHEGGEFTFYNKENQEKVLHAALNTQTYSGRVVPIYAQEINLSGVSKSVELATKKRASEVYQVPVYLKIDNQCQYLPSLINGKLQMQYKLLSGGKFDFSDLYPDTNRYDNKLEFFTSAFLYGKKLLIGYLKVQNLVEKHTPLMGMNMDFIKGNQLDHSSIDVKGRKIETPEVEALLEDTLQDFDIRGMHCEINDENFQVNVNCRCASKY